MAGWFSDYSWNPSEWGGVSDIPIVGDVHKGLFGDPEAIKAAYDKAIGLSQAGSKDIKDFLMGQQGKAQRFYAPIQNMFQGMYGTQGLKPQQTASDPNIGPIENMYRGGR